MDARIIELLQAAEALPPGQEAVELIQAAIRESDEAGQTMLSLLARQMMMHLSRSLLLTGELATAFTWTLSKFDEDPQQYARFNPIYEFRWVISLLGNFPTISIDKRDELLEQMSQRYQSAGLSQQAVEEVRATIAADYGDPLMANRAMERLKSHPECEHEMEYSLRHREIDCCLLNGDVARAIQLAEPYLRDESHDWQLNNQLCTGLLLPLHQRGQHEVAEAIEMRVRKDPSSGGDVYFWHYGDLAMYWVLTSEAHPERLEWAVRFYQRFQRVISEFSDPLTELHFYLDSLPLLDRLSRNNLEIVGIHLPSAVTAEQRDGGYTVDSLRKWVAQQSQQLVNQFDERNKNDFFSVMRDQRQQLVG